MASASSGLLGVGVEPVGKPANSGAIACVRAGLRPPPVPTGSPAIIRRRASSLGTASVKLNPVFCRSASTLPKKNVRLEAIGPPNEPPN